MIKSEINNQKLIETAKAMVAENKGLLAMDGHPEENAHALARYAALCQEAGIVPIVEPDAQKALYHRVIYNRAARMGEYNIKTERK